MLARRRHAKSKSAFGPPLRPELGSSAGQVRDDVRLTTMSAYFSAVHSFSDTASS